MYIVWVSVPYQYQYRFWYGYLSSIGIGMNHQPGIGIGIGMVVLGEHYFSFVNIIGMFFASYDTAFCLVPTYLVSSIKCPAYLKTVYIFLKFCCSRTSLLCGMINNLILTGWLARKGEKLKTCLDCLLRNCLSCQG